MANIYGFGGTAQSQYAGSSFGRSPAVPRRGARFGLGALSTFGLNAPRQQQQGMNVSGPAALNTAFGLQQRSGAIPQLEEAFLSDITQGEQYLQERERMGTQLGAGISEDFLGKQSLIDEQLQGLTSDIDQREMAGASQLKELEGLQAATKEKRQEAFDKESEAFDDFTKGMEGYAADTRRSMTREGKELERLGGKIRSRASSARRRVTELLDKAKDDYRENQTVAAASAQVGAIQRNVESMKDRINTGLDARGMPLSQGARTAAIQQVEDQAGRQIQGAVGELYQKVNEADLSIGLQKAKVEMSALTDPSVAISAQLEAAGISKQAQGEQFEAQALMNLETRKFDQKSKEAQFGVAMAMGDEEAFAVRKNLQDSNNAAVSDLRQRTVGLAMQSQAAELSGNFQLAEYYMNNMQAPVSQANSMIAFLTARSIPGIGQMSGFPTTT